MGCDDAPVPGKDDAPVSGRDVAPVSIIDAPYALVSARRAFAAILTRRRPSLMASASDMYFISSSCASVRCFIDMSRKSVGMFDHKKLLLCIFESSVRNSKPV